MPGPPTSGDTGDESDDRLIARDSPVGASESSLASRDYQPRHGGPELITSWSIGPPPDRTEPNEADWELTSDQYVTIDRSYFTLPYAGPVDYSMIYLNVCGAGYVDAEGADSAEDTGDATLSLVLANPDLSGKASRTECELTNRSRKRFASSMIEVTPETRDRDHAPYSKLGKVFGEYELDAKVTGGTGYVDRGTCVQLWSE